MDTAWYQRVSGASKRPGAGEQNIALHALILKSGWCVIRTYCNETHYCDTQERGRFSNRDKPPPKRIPAHP